ncbi:MAG: hypothetical protein ACI4GA_05095 [Acutalibacteraceae bacterium]|nr:hypothetical protein [Oscillospiraceae bacterium]
MKRRKVKNFKKVNEAISVWHDETQANTDALGSYTGTPSENDLIPEQDGDDI